MPGKWLTTILVLVLFCWVESAPAAEPELERRLSVLESQMRDSRVELLQLETAVIDLRQTLEWSDVPYVNNLLMSLSAMEACLYYQAELAAVYRDVAAFQTAYVRSHSQRMETQARYTQTQLDIEARRITYQYLQIINTAVLNLIDRARQTVKAARQALDTHIRWLEELRASVAQPQT